MVSYYQGMNCYGCNYMGGDMCAACADVHPDGREETVKLIKLSEQKESSKK